MSVPRPLEILWIMSAVLLAACGSTDRPYREPEAMGTSSSDACDDRVAERPVAADELLDGGSPRQLADAFGGTFKAPLQWNGQREGGRRSLDFVSHDTTVQLELVIDATSARQVEWQNTGSSRACPSTQEYDAVLSLVTDDGTFAETFAGTLSLQSAQRGFFWTPFVPVDELHGSYDSSWYEVPAPVLSLSTSITRETTSMARAITGTMWLGVGKPQNGRSVYASGFVASW